MKRDSRNANRRALILQLIILAVAFVTTKAQTLPGSSLDTGTYIHGTVVLVLPTKDGFVLASDSRGSRGCDAVAGNFQKVFPIGKNAAIVVAGLISSTDKDNEISDSLAARLKELDQSAGEPNAKVDAAWIIRQFVESVRAETFLLSSRQFPDSTLVAGASAVSLGSKGEMEWITSTLRSTSHTNYSGYSFMDVKLDQFVSNPSSPQVLGSGKEFVEQLLGLDHPSENNKYSEFEVMKKYYELKRQNRLREMSVSQGEELARFLVESTISFAATQPCLGIGGGPNVLTVREGRTDWIVKQDPFVTSTAFYRARMSDSTILESLDGIQCIRCTVPANFVIRFDGDADAHIVDTHFDGHCVLLLGDDAERKMPSTSQRLKQTLGSVCDVYKGREKVSSGASVGKTNANDSEIQRLTSLDNRRLKREVRDFVSNLKVTLEESWKKEQKFIDDESLAESKASSEAEGRVLKLQHDLLAHERYYKILDLCRTQYVPELALVADELVKRLNTHPDVQSQMPVSTPSQVYSKADYVQALANRLPESPAP